MGCKASDVSQIEPSSSKTSKLHFETLQVHAGQENADSATDARVITFSFFLFNPFLLFLIK
jgi:hypothetical protein